jgi:hypothetical protein
MVECMRVVPLVSSTLSLEFVVYGMLEVADYVGVRYADRSVQGWSSIIRAASGVPCSVLSAEPGDKESLINYAASNYHMYKSKTGPANQKLKEAAAKFYKALVGSEAEFEQLAMISEVRTVLSPSWNAVSIVI